MTAAIIVTGLVLVGIVYAWGIRLARRREARILRVAAFKADRKPRDE